MAAGRSPRSSVDTLQDKKSATPPAAGSASIRLRRGLWLVFPLLAVLAAAVYLPPYLAAKQEAQMRRMTLPEIEKETHNRPDDMTARYLLGLAYAKEGRYPEAVREFLSVLDKEPTRVEALNDLGAVYLLQDRYYESLVALQGATTAKPDYAPAWANMGRLHLATKMPFTAVKELEKAIQLEPRSVSALCDLGEAYQRTLNHNAAEKVFKQALEVDSRSVQARLGLGKTYYAKANYEQAEKELATAQAQAPEDAQILLTLGRIRMEKARAPEDLKAIQTLQETALRADPDNPDVWYDKGRIAMRLEQPTEAIEYFRRTLQLSPQHLGAMNQLERALRKAGRTADADRLAKIFQKRVLEDREETQLEERITHYPQDWDAQARLTELYLNTDKRGLATLVCLRLKNGAPDHPKLPDLMRRLNLNAANAPSAVPQVTRP